MYSDAVLLVWKPVESCGPVTYIVQCCIEGIGFLRLRPLCKVDTERHCGCVCSVSVGGLRKGVPLIRHNCFSLSPVWSGGSWTTLASDISDCCYVTSKLSRGGMYTFRTACVSKAGMGPYSSPSDQVLLGGLNHLGKLWGGWDGEGWPSDQAWTPSCSQMIYLPAFSIQSLHSLGTLASSSPPSLTSSLLVLPRELIVVDFYFTG